MPRNNVLYIERDPGQDAYAFTIEQKSFLQHIDEQGGEIVAVVPDIAANYSMVKGVWVYWRTVEPRPTAGR